MENDHIHNNQVEILVNEPYSSGPGPDGDGKGSGQFTHKVYHIGRWLLNYIILKVWNTDRSIGHYNNRYRLLHSIQTQPYFYIYVEIWLSLYAV